MERPPDTGPPLADDLLPLRSFVAARVDNTGRLVEANTGFRNILPVHLRDHDSANVAHIFLQPAFRQLMEFAPAEKTPVYTGPMTLGEASHKTYSFLGRVMRYPCGIRVVAEYDVDEVDRLYRLSIDNIYALAEKERELTATYKHIKEVSVTDPLTGVANRRNLEEHINTEIDRASRYGHAFSIVMCDLDHFKAINDGYGHQAGDKILIAFANIMKQWARKSDFVARYGGEEFVIVMPDTRQDMAAATAERLRFTVENTTFESVTGPVTASYGIAEWLKCESADSLLKRADDALYQAKACGRNKVIMASR